jgi:hypothetical protein
VTRLVTPITMPSNPDSDMNPLWQDRRVAPRDECAAPLRKPRVLAHGRSTRLIVREWASRTQPGLRRDRSRQAWLQRIDVAHGDDVRGSLAPYLDGEPQHCRRMPRASCRLAARSLARRSPSRHNPRFPDLPRPLHNHPLRFSTALNSDLTAPSSDGGFGKVVPTNRARAQMYSSVRILNSDACAGPSPPPRTHALARDGVFLMISDA